MTMAARIHPCSSDATASMTRALSDSIPGLRLISYAKNRGKGYALRAGVLSSRGKLVLLSDADLSTPIEELESLMKFIAEESYQIAIGSRALALSREWARFSTASSGLW